MQLKKIFVSLLVVVIALTTLTFAASAANTVDFAVSVQGTADANGDIVFTPGEVIEVVIDVHNNLGIALLEVQIKYDVNVLTFVDYEIGNFLDSKHVPDLKTAEGLLGFASEATLNPAPIVDEDGEVIKDGEIVTLTFKVKENAHAEASSIKLAYAEAYDASYEAVAIKTTNGKFAVHNVQETAGKEATCFEKGYTASVKCADCDYGVASTELPALNHEGFLEVIPAKPGSCTSPAVSAGEKCTKCGTVTVEPVTGDSVAHTPNGTWEVVEPATHLKPGKQQQKCVNCGEVALEAVVPQILAHNWVQKGEPVAPTCLDAGYTIFECECGETKHDALVAAKGHTYTEAGKVDATCNKPGEITYACACGVKYTTNTELAKHEYQSEITKAATCTASGVKTNTCKVCGDVYVETVDMIAHTFTDAVTAPTCTTMGYTTHTCSACEYKVVDTFVDAKGHTLVVDEAVNPTATAEGKTQGLHCSECDLVHLAQTTVPALGLTWLWVMIAVVVIVAGACVGLYFICKKSFGK